MALKSKWITVPLDEQEQREIKAAAEADERKVAQWARIHLLKAARDALGPPPPHEEQTA